jgi:hypothetical protein
MHTTNLLLLLLLLLLLSSADVTVDGTTFNPGEIAANLAGGVMTLSLAAVTKLFGAACGANTPNLGEWRLVGRGWACWYGLCVAW